MVKDCSSTGKATPVKKKKVATKKVVAPIDVTVLDRYPHIATRVADALDELRKNDPKSRDAFHAAYIAVARNFVSLADWGAVKSALGHVLGKHRKKIKSQHADLFQFSGKLHGESYLVVEDRTMVEFTFRYNRSEPVLTATRGQAMPGVQMEVAAIAFAHLYFKKPTYPEKIAEGTLKGISMKITTGEVVTVVDIDNTHIVFRIDDTHMLSFVVSGASGKTVKREGKVQCLTSPEKVLPTKTINALRKIAICHMSDTRTMQLPY